MCFAASGVCVFRLNERTACREYLNSNEHSFTLGELFARTCRNAGRMLARFYKRGAKFMKNV